MKTFNRSDVFSWSNTEEAKEYLGKDCYFAHSVGGLSEHIKTGVMGILQDIFNSNYDAVSCAFGDGTSTWGLCLPAEKVIEAADKKYRPFRDIDEMKSTLDIELGDAVVHRFKKFIDTGTEVHSIFSSYSVSSASKETTFMLTGFTTPCGLEYAFKAIEWKTEDGEWLPFGVEVEE